MISVPIEILQRVLMSKTTKEYKCFFRDNQKRPIKSLLKREIQWSATHYQNQNLFSHKGRKIKLARISHSLNRKCHFQVAILNNNIKNHWYIHKNHSISQFKVRPLNWRLYKLMLVSLKCCNKFYRKRGAIWVYLQLRFKNASIGEREQSSNQSRLHANK